MFRMLISLNGCEKIFRSFLAEFIFFNMFDPFVKGVYWRTKALQFHFIFTHMWIQFVNHIGIISKGIPLYILERSLTAAALLPVALQDICRKAVQAWAAGVAEQNLRSQRYIYSYCRRHGRDAENQQFRNQRRKGWIKQVFWRITLNDLTARF